MLNVHMGCQTDSASERPELCRTVPDLKATAHSEDRQPPGRTRIIPLPGLIVERSARMVAGARRRSLSLENWSETSRIVCGDSSRDCFGLQIVVTRLWVDLIQLQVARIGSPLPRSSRGEPRSIGCFAKAASCKPCGLQVVTRQSHVRDASPSEQDKATAGQPSLRWSQRADGWLPGGRA